MNSGATVETAAGAECHRTGWGASAARLAHRIAREDFPRGDLAALRRMTPGAPAAAYWRLMAEEDLLGSPAVERKWALILQGIAIMTPTANRPGNGRGAHDPGTPVGRALFLGDDPARSSALYSEMRLNRLLSAHGPALHALLARMFRMLAAQGVSLDWREMARFILSDGYDEERGEEARRRIARAYYRAEPRPAADHPS